MDREKDKALDRNSDKMDTIEISRKEYEELKEKAWKYDELSK